MSSSRRTLALVRTAIVTFCLAGAARALAAADPITGDPDEAGAWEAPDRLEATAADPRPVSGAEEAGPLPIAGALYATNGAALYTIDKATGTSTLVGFHGGVDVAVGALGFDAASTLWCIDTTASAALHTVDPATGVRTAIGALDIGFVFEGGLAFAPDGRLFAANVGSAAAAKLFEVDVETGEGAIVGPPLGEIRDLNALVYDAGVLLALDRASDSLGVVDPATGEFEAIGLLGTTIGSFAGLARDPADGQLYAAIGSADSTDPSDLYTIDRATGEATFVAALTIPVYDLAFAPLAFFRDSFESGDLSGWSATVP